MRVINKLLTFGVLHFNFTSFKTYFYFYFSSLRTVLRLT